MKYNKVTEEQVLEAFCNVEVINQWYVPKFVIAKYLRTSLYQVNKHCKELIKKGYLRKRREEPYHDYDYEYGVDYGNSLSILITEITEQGINRIKDLGLYKNKWYEDLKMED